MTITSTNHSIFLETSIQIRRTQLAPDDSTRIDSILALPTTKACTSQYVWMEYQRTFIADCVYIHKLMGQYSRWGTLLKNLVSGQRAFRPRSVTRCVYLLGQLQEQCFEDYEFAREMLQEQISQSLPKQFWANVIPLSDPIFCDLVTERINVLPDSHQR